MGGPGMSFAGLVLLLNLFSAGFEIDPSAVEWFRKGEELIGTDKEFSDLQAEYFEKAVQLSPKFVAAHYNLVLVYLRQDRLERALDHCNQLVKLAPDDVPVLELRAQVYGRQGKMDLAIQDLVAASQQDPDNHQIWQDLGLFLSQRNRLDEALAAYERALQLEPSAVAVYFEMALVQRDLENYVDALHSCLRFLEAQPEDFRGHFLLGLIYRQQGNRRDALQSLLKAESLNPDDPDIALELSNLYLDLGDLETAELRLGKNAAADRYLNLGLAAKERQQWVLAERYFRQALAKESQNSLFWMHMGDVLVKLDRKGEAVSAYERSLEADPDQFASLLNVATLYAKDGRHKEALKHLEHAVELRPEEGLAHLNLAIVQESLGDDFGAQANYLKTINLGAGNPNVHFRLAIIFSRKSQVDDAIKHLSIAFDGDGKKFVPIVLNELRNVKSDLDSIRYTAKFDELLERYRKKLEIGE
jgi:superkiller protein 3